MVTDLSAVITEVFNKVGKTSSYSLVVLPKLLRATHLGCFNAQQLTRNEQQCDKTAALL